MAIVLPPSDSSPLHSDLPLLDPLPLLLSNHHLSLSEIALLRRVYPKPIDIPSAIIEEESLPWKFSLVGKFLGRLLPFEKVHDGLSGLQNLENVWEIFPYFIFRFTFAQDLDRVLLDGPWMTRSLLLVVGPYIFAHLWRCSFWRPSE